MGISAQNLNFLRALRDRGVMVDVNAGQMDLGNGIIAIPCCDGDHMHDLYERLAQMFHGVSDGDPRIHLLPRHGGAMCLSPRWPGSAIKSESLREEVIEAYGAKGITTVVPYVHFPCAMKRKYGLAAPAVVDMLIDAKMEVKRIAKEILHIEMRVIPCIHIHWDGSGIHARKRTYKITRKAWDDVRAEFLDMNEAAA